MILVTDLVSWSPSHEHATSEVQVNQAFVLVQNPIAFFQTRTTTVCLGEGSWLISWRIFELMLTVWFLFFSSCKKNFLLKRGMYYDGIVWVCIKWGRPQFSSRNLPLISLTHVQLLPISTAAFLFSNSLTSHMKFLLWPLL